MEWFQENEWIVDRASGHDVCVMDDECGTKEQRAKNAALIAAAPDLLESTKQMLRLVDGLPWELRDAVYKAFNERTGGLPGTLPKPITNARAAIAKAEGSPQ